MNDRSVSEAEAGAVGFASDHESAQTKKVTRVLAACRNGDLSSLIALATSTHGLVNDEARRAACETDVKNDTVILHSDLQRAIAVGLYRVKSRCQVVDRPAATSRGGPGRP